MRERKYIKFRVDMYDDTKFKIIDMNFQRDLIHYVWTRLVTLAGKVNCEGNLYMSRNIPYTMETLAIEFNRGVEQIKSALDLLITLEMVEISEHNIYKVRNFVKHQNIKTGQKNKIQNEEKDEKNIRSGEKEGVDNEIKANDSREKQEEIIINNDSNDRQGNDEDHMANDMETTYKTVEKDDNSSASTKMINDNLQGNMLIPLKKKKNNRSNKKHKDKFVNDIAEISEDEQLICFYEGESPPLGKGDSIVSEFVFN